MKKTNSKMGYKRSIFIIVSIALLTYLFQVDIDNVIIFIKELFK